MLKPHLRALREALARLLASKLATAMTLLALGISIAVPTLLFSLTEVFGGWFERWDGRPQVSLYFEPGRSAEQVKTTLDTVQNHPLIGSSDVIPADQGLADLARRTGLEDLVSSFSENPLPTVGVLYLKGVPEKADIDALRSLLDAQSGIEHIQYDLDWLNRVQAMARFLKSAVILFAGLLGLGAALLISNTVRLEIQHRQEELRSQDLLGATRGYIRRPFLYYGALEGLGGGLTGVIITLAGHLSLEQPLAELSRFYPSATGMQPLWFLQVALAVLLLGTVLGWVAAHITVDRHLESLKPE